MLLLEFLIRYGELWLILVCGFVYFRSGDWCLYGLNVVAGDFCLL
jgi:hypothetical protein